MTTSEQFANFLARMNMAPADEGGAGDTGGGDDVAIGGNTDDAADAGTGETQDNPSDSGGGDGSSDAGDEGGDDVIAIGGGADENDAAEGSDEAGGEDDGDVPEAYDFTDVLPEGTEIDQGLLDAVTPVFKDLGLTQEKASALTKAYAEAQAAQAEAMNEQITEIVSGWRKEAMADKEIGGDNWAQTTKVGNALVKKFGDKALVDEILVGAGYGNHPAMIRFLSRIGSQFSDDTFVTGEHIDTSEPMAKEVAWYGATTPTEKKG